MNIYKITYKKNGYEYIKHGLPIMLYSDYLTFKENGNIFKIRLKEIISFKFIETKMEYIEINRKFDLKKYPQLKYVTKIWQTKCGTYEIYYDKISKYEHLRIKRIDRKPLGENWYWILQEIKNDIFGKEKTACIILPRELNHKKGLFHHIWTWEGIEMPNLIELYDYK